LISGGFSGEEINGRRSGWHESQGCRKEIREEERKPKNPRATAACGTPLWEVEVPLEIG
jgi:hypothetical protein